MQIPATHSPARQADTGPWWRYELAWMVWAGPALVIAASVASFLLAVGRPDEALPTQATASAAPAHAARNHVATGDVPTAGKRPPAAP